MAEGPHAEIVCAYFQHVRLLLVEGLVLGDISVATLRRVTAKELYVGYTSTFPPPKVILKYDVDWSLVWKRLNSPSLDSLAREVLFSIVHNIIPNRQRLFSKMNMVAHPNCLLCGVVEDNTHIFTGCVMVREAWGWMRLRLLSLLPDECSRISNMEFVHLFFSEHPFDMEIVWLVGTFVELVWKEKMQQKRKKGIEKAIGHMKQKFKENQFSIRYVAN